MGANAFVLGVGSSNQDLAASLRTLMGKAAITSRADLKAFVLTGNLPAGNTITPAVFQRALLLLSVPLFLVGETDATAADTGT